MSDTAYLMATGSRNLRSYPLVCWAATDAWHDTTQDGYINIIGVHGEAEGADMLFDQWCKENGIPVKPFPANWDADCIVGRCKPDHRRPRRDGSTFCPAEGNYRNQRMVDWLLSVAEPGAVLVLAFWEQPRSTGTANAVRLARAAEFTVRPFGNLPPEEKR